MCTATKGGDPITANPVKAALRGVCLDVVDELGLLGATITVMAAEGVEASVAASGPAIQAMADLQFTLGEGPSSDAFTGRRPVLVPDLAASDGRWMGFTPAALDAGVVGVYAFPLGLGAAPLGVLTCYRAMGDPLETPQLRRCLLAADEATMWLLSADGAEGTAAVRARSVLESSFHIRTEVYQAQGMMMVELGISLRDAMARLRAIAYSENLDLNDLAADLVAGRRDFPERDLR